MFIKIEWHERKKWCENLGTFIVLSTEQKQAIKPKRAFDKLKQMNKLRYLTNYQGLLSLFPTSGAEPIKAQQVGGTSVPPCPRRPLYVGIWRHRLVERQPKLKHLFVYFCKYVFLCNYICVLAFAQVAQSLLAFHSSPWYGPALCSQGPIFSQAP